MTHFHLTRPRARLAAIHLPGLRAVDLAVLSAGALLVAFIGAVSGTGFG